jgi:hypothetical protein
LRLTLLAIWLPTSLIGGLIASGILAKVLGIWNEYISAVLLPILGLVPAWILARPFQLGSRIAAVAMFMGVGLSLAVWLAFPSDFPETHELAYQSTYVPFALTVLTTAVVLGSIAIAEWRGRGRGS